MKVYLTHCGVDGPAPIGVRLQHEVELGPLTLDFLSRTVKTLTSLIPIQRQKRIYFKKIYMSSNRQTIEGEILQMNVNFNAGGYIDVEVEAKDEFGNIADVTAESFISQDESIIVSEAQPDDPENAQKRRFRSTGIMSADGVVCRFSSDPDAANPDDTPLELSLTGFVRAGAASVGSFRVLGSSPGTTVESEAPPPVEPEVPAEPEPTL